MTESIMDRVKVAKARVPAIAAEEARAIADRPGVLFLDVRDDHEIAHTGKVAGAMHVSRGTLEFKADQDSPMFDDRFEDARTIIVYCATGGRAALSGATLLDMGYADVRTMDSLNAWTEIDGEVET